MAHEYDHALQDQYWDLNKVTDVQRHPGRPGAGAPGARRGRCHDRDAPVGIPEPEPGRAVAGRVGDDACRSGPPRRHARAPASSAGVPVPRGPGVRHARSWARVAGTASNAAWDGCRPPPSRSCTPSDIPSTRRSRWSCRTSPRPLATAGRPAYLQTMGELDISVLLGDAEDGAAAAEGWGGDRLVSLDGPDGSWAVVWQTAWDSARMPTSSAPRPTRRWLDLDGAQPFCPAPISRVMSMHPCWSSWPATATPCSRSRGRSASATSRRREPRSTQGGRRRRRPHICSGVEIPSRPRVLRSARRAVSTSASRCGGRERGRLASTTRRSR